MRRFAASLAALFLSAPLGAHPHIFIDTGLELYVDDSGRLTDVRVIWTYDELYSLLIMEDRGLDPDFDGVLTEAEIADLTGFDMQWTEGFNGDLVIERGGAAVPLSGPREATASYEDGRITTTHLRQVKGGGQAGAPWNIRPYDITYYSAYDITLPVRVIGRDGCRHDIVVPDIDARLRELADVLNSLDTVDMASQTDMPDIGGMLASTVVLSCE